jgi:hypothetical protein
VPKGVDPEILKRFIENDDDPKKQQQKVQNTRNRGELKITHCLGRCTYAQKVFKKVHIIVYNILS